MFILKLRKIIVKKWTKILLACSKDLCSFSPWEIRISSSSQTTGWLMRNRTNHWKLTKHMKIKSSFLTVYSYCLRILVSKNLFKTCYSSQFYIFEYFSFYILKLWKYLLTLTKYNSHLVENGVEMNMRTLMEELWRLFRCLLL